MAVDIYDDLLKIKVGPGDGFFPRGEVEKFWTDDNDKKLRSILEEDSIEYAKKNLLKTVSLLILSGAPNVAHTIRKMVEDGKPLDAELDKINPTDPYLSLAPTSTSTVNHQALFQYFRPMFTAPVLTEDEDLTLKIGQIMPLVDVNEEPSPGNPSPGNPSPEDPGPRVEVIGRGMSGVIMAYKIPRGHLKRNGELNQEEVPVAKKTYITSSITHQRELSVLKEIRTLLMENRNVQICPPICLVTDGSGVHSLSLRARCQLGDKLEELQRSYNGSLNEGRLMDSIRQMKGIAGAVKFLHEAEPYPSDMCYCHMDIAPRNILIFGLPSDILSVGDWKLIDFGITKYSQKKKWRTSGGDRDGGTPRVTITVGTYLIPVHSAHQPPEIVENNIKRSAQLGDPITVMGRGSDIWSLACVFAQVLAANLGELNKLDDCKKSFYEKETRSCISSGYRRHSAFDQWLKKLPKEGESMDILTSCRNLIKGMTHIQRIRRLKATQVLERMEKFPGLDGSSSANAPS
ncbi:kinase-like domain-containing protein [Xylaria sp. FL0933]|nr:kinase-like domain-containing protein [Xylaria sp. FL0933]